METQQDLDYIPTEEFINICKTIGVDSTGTRDELIERIRIYMESKNEG